MRPLTRTAAAVTTVLGAGAAVVAAGWHAGRSALRASASSAPPGFEGPALTVRPLPPAGGRGRPSGGERIALTRSATALLPGRYGLTGWDGHAVLGEVLQGEGADRTVVRRLERATGGPPPPGTRVRLTPQVHVGDPGTALGMEFTEVEVAGELGALPAWFVPGWRDTWVVTVHGLGTTREHPMVVLPFLHGWQLPVLDLAHRGDPGAPVPEDGRTHLGEREWRDLDAAVRFAVDQGAERVVLYGWSTGATMALRTAERSELRGRIAGLVLDSAVLDPWHARRALAAARAPRGPLLPLATRAATARAATARRRSERAGGHPAVSRDAPTGAGPPASGPTRSGAAPAPPALSVPTLVLHSPDDTVAPWSAARALARANPATAMLHGVPGARHAALWNLDPVGYEEVLRRFLTPLM